MHSVIDHRAFFSLQVAIAALFLPSDHLLSTTRDLSALSASAMSLTPRPSEDDLSSGMAAATLSTESDYGSDFDENDETTLTSLVSFAETGTAEQQWLQPAFPETVDPNERAPVAHIPLSQHASQSHSTQPWSTGLPVSGKSASQEEYDLFGAGQVESMHIPSLGRKQI